MKKTINIIGRIVQIAALPVVISSFFVEDPKTAVNRRWLAVGLFTGGTIARAATMKVDPAYKAPAKKTEYEVHAYDKSGTLRNPIFGTEKAAKDVMADYKKLGYTRISMAPIYS